MKYTEKELCLIWLDSFIGLEYKHKAYLYKNLGEVKGIRSFIQNNAEYIKREIGENNYSTLLNSANAEYLDFVLGELRKSEVRVITIDSEIYPPLLLQTDIPPLVLYAKGNVELLNTQCFAMVGSRKSLPLSIKTAEKYAIALSDAGLTLVTGIAEGIDKAVIESALNTGRIISVIAGGFNHIYPATHTSLFEEVYKKGLAISEHSLDVVPQPYFFPARNRIIAGLSKGTLVVSGARKSGTKYTATFAEEYGRDLFAIPYNVGVASGEGCNELIKMGAHLTDTPDDILDFYGLTRLEEENVYSDEERIVLSALDGGSLHVEKISDITGKKPFELTAILSALEIKGAVAKVGANVYSKI